jgi:hypothetical protein
MTPYTPPDASNPPAPHESLVNALADRYHVERTLGAGGMATVYLARDLRHDREVALKVLRPELAAVLGADRFLNEVRITARLEHPHIATLIDSGESGGYLWYVLPYIRGESLRDRLRREGQLAIDESIAITRQVAGALDYAHRQGVVHRDIKPENIMIHEGEAMLVDFGIALAVKEAGGNRLTETGLSLGTPQYMSPEQATGDRVLDARSDVYSLAAVLYEMLAGEPPHAAPTAQATIAKLLTERPTRLRVVRDTVPVVVDDAIAKALSKVPADRFPGAGDFARALVVTADRRPDESRRRSPWMIPGIVAAMAAVAVAAVVAINFMGGRQRPAPDTTQVTTNGNAFGVALSPDETRIAYGARSCDQAGGCTMGIVVQDIAGAGAATIVRGMTNIWYIQWTDDSRYIVFSGQAPNGTWGSYSISSIGGDVRFLGCCGGFYVAGDTILLNAGNPQDSIAVSRWISVVDGRRYRELMTHHPARSWPMVIPVAPGYVVAQTWRGTYTRLHVIDSMGRATDSLSFLFERRSPTVPAPRGTLLLHSARPGESASDIIAVRVDRNGRLSRPDTIIRRLQLWGPISVTRNGSAVYSAGPVSYEVWKGTRVSQRLTEPLTRTRVASATALLAGLLDRQGRNVALLRATAIGSPLRQLSVLTGDGGPERPLGPPMEIHGVEWTHDASAILARVAVGSDSGEIREFNVANGSVRPIMPAAISQLGWVETLPGGGFVLVPRSGDTLFLRGIPRRNDTTIVLAEQWMGAYSASASPDGRHLVVAGWDRAGDSVAFNRLSLADGSFDRIATIWADGWRRPAWLADGRLILPVVEAMGAVVLYTVERYGDPPVRLGPSPWLDANFSWSLDGRAVVANVLDVRPDAYQIRNFPEIMGWR